VLDDKVDPVVIDRVESLGCVEKEEEPVKMFFNPFIEVCVYIDHMVATLPTT
jgi:hypothetical protein